MNVSVFNAIFIDNIALLKTGAVIANNNPSTTVVNCTFLGNHIIDGASTVYKNCVLTVLVNNQYFDIVNCMEDIKLTAKLVDDKNNIYYSTGLTYKIRNINGFVKIITADELFNAITNPSSLGYSFGYYYDVTANYADPYAKITNAINNALLFVLVPNDSFTALDALIQSNQLF